MNTGGTISTPFLGTSTAILYFGPDGNGGYQANAQFPWGVSVVAMYPNGDGTFNYPIGFDDNGNVTGYNTYSPDPILLALRAYDQNNTADLAGAASQARAFRNVFAPALTDAQLAAAVPVFGNQHRAALNSGYTQGSNYVVIAQRILTDAMAAAGLATGPTIAALYPAVVAGAEQAKQRWQQTQQAGSHGLMTVLVSLAVAAAFSYFGFPEFFNSLISNVMESVSAEAAEVAAAQAETLAQAQAMAAQAQLEADAMAATAQAQATAAAATEQAAAEAVALTAPVVDTAPIIQQAVQAQTVADTIANTASVQDSLAQAAQAVADDAAEQARLAQQLASQSTSTTQQAIAEQWASEDSLLDPNAETLPANPAPESPLPKTITPTQASSLAQQLSNIAGPAKTALTGASLLATLYKAIAGPGGTTAGYQLNPAGPQTYGAAAASPFLVPSGVDGVLANTSPIAQSLILPGAILVGAYLFANRKKKSRSTQEGSHHEIA